MNSTGLFVIVLGCIIPGACAASEQCDLRQELRNSSLELVAHRRIANSAVSRRMGSEKYPFYPIGGIYFVQGRLSARTFGADYFPADLRRGADGKLRLEQLTYRIPVPGGPKDELADNVKAYRESDTQAIVEHYDCRTRELKLHIFSGEGGIDEVLYFRELESGG